MKTIFSIAVLFLWLGTFDAHSQEDRKLSKKEKKIEEFNKTRRMLERGNYEFVANWAYTNLGYRINLLSNPNHLTMHGNQADIRLPFFGEARTANAALNNTGGLVYEGEVQNLEMEVNEKKREIFIRFQTSWNTEILDFSLKVFGSGTSSLNVNSTQRSRINYDGKTRALKDES